MGGDEFVVLTMDDVDNNQEMIINRFNENIKSINSKKDRNYQLSISIGISSNNDTSSLDELVSRADEAMYRSKKQKKHQQNI